MSESLIISLAAGADYELDICVDLIVENILAMFDPDCNEKSCRAVPGRVRVPAPGQWTSWGESESVQVYSVYSGHVHSVQPPEIMNAVTSCLLGSWSVSLSRPDTDWGAKKFLAARKQNNIC